MKIEVEDIDQIMQQITNMVPPMHKADHKILNALKNAIEKNVTVSNSHLQELTIKNEQKEAKMMSLAFLRKDLPLEATEEFKCHIDFIKEQIESKKEASALQYRTPKHRTCAELNDTIENEIRIANENITAIKGKLQRTKEVAEEAFSKSSGRFLKPLEYAEKFFRCI